MTSRLDRLFILLESGSTAATRHAAAKQIGEVQKLYPHELHALLNRLVGYLHSASWETRIAAAQSVEAILKQVPPWQPELQLPAIDLKKERKASDATEEDSCQSNASSVTTETLLSFDEFDLQQILLKGARLIGSEGNEFDVQEEQPASGGGPEDQSVAARLSRQRALLNDKLGLTTAAKLGVNLTDMITDEDVALARTGTSYNINAEKLPVEHILNIKPANGGGGEGAVGQRLSCREINRAKRKARQGSSTAASTVTPTSSRRNSNAGIGAGSNSSSGSGSSCSNNHNNNSSINGNGAITADEPEKKKLKANDRHEIFYSLNAAVPDVTGTWVDAVSWPLENFCARLFIDLFHAKWEVRHGAATALRELINQHGKGAGKCVLQSAEQMHEAHSRWLEDAAIRLLCVLCLDRFGDFVSDQVVAPVRETCAQVLGTLVKAIDEAKVHRIVDILLQLIRHKNEWEVRHGGLLGLKYVFVVREELLPNYLPKSISDILLGLLDDVDDVGAVAAATLIPVAIWLPKLLNAAQVSSIVKMLWDLLLDQDELTSACNSFMGLLAAILCLPQAANWIQMEPIGTLVPRLFPFLSHSTSSVRRSTLKTLITLTSSGEDELKREQDSVKLELETVGANGNRKALKLNFGVVDWNWQLLQQALRHIYQRMLVEPQADIQALAHKVWSNLIEHANLGALLHAACPHVSSWICLAMQPPRLSFDPGVLIRAVGGCDAATSGSGTRRRTPRIGDDLGGAALAHSNAMQKLYLGGSEATPLELREANFMRARITASRVLGALSHYLVQPAPGVLYTPQMESPTDCYTKVLLGHLNARSAVQRIVCGLIIAFWALNDEPVRPGPPNLQEKLHQCVSEYFYYDEVAMSLTRLLQESQDFIATLKQNKIPINDFNNAKILTLDQIKAVSTTLSDNLRIYALKPKVMDTLLDRRRSLQASYQQTTSEQGAYHVSAQAALAGAICALHCLPDKLNPVVKPLMESIKREQCVPLQQLSADFLVHLMDQVCDRNPSPNSKILNNLCTLLRSDADHTPKLLMPEHTLLETRPTANDTCEYYGILTLTQQQAASSVTSNSSAASTRAGAPPLTPTPRGPGRPPASEVMAAAAAAAAHVEVSCQQAKEAEARLCRIQRLGAASAIAKLCSTFGERIVDKVPIFQQLMFGKLEQFVASTDTQTLASTLPELASCNELISSLQLIETAAPHLHEALHEQLFALLPQLGFIARHSLKVLRHMAARCIAALAEINACRTMQFVVTELLGLLLKIERPIERQGAVEAIERVVNRLQIRVVPYIVLLVVPLLGAMSDANESVRLLATHSFATLVQLMPLDSSSGSGKTAQELKSEPLQERKTRDREFLDYLFAPKTIPDYHVPVALSVELRGYQQAGINWLWFLNKYNLHGILCDDMGLGKTLQTICILAGDHMQRQEAKLSPLPSLVICPPTLTGHWVYEVEKFLAQSPVLRPLHYFGFPVGREKLRSQIGTSCNLVVASYDTVRKDIEYFSGIHFNYCVLDEGHIIKNGKTKSSKAIKQLKANHRLILSGTPIQNNVLELWSLFDFLMPGFLGTEKQFIQRYSRPILASRDAKSSPKEQEAGVLAMESLHRQVLPFLLRRVKEDVLTDLPPKITQDLLCELSPLQLRLYDDFSNKHLKDCLDKLETENLGAKTHIFQALRYLQNVCNHPKLVLRQSGDDLNKVAIQLSLNNTSLDDIEHSAKLPALKQLLLDCGIGVQTESVSQHRALIFCQLKAMLDIVEHDLLRRHLPSVTYLRLDGSVPASLRQDIVNNFNSDPSIDVLLLTTLVGGLGLNLTGADTVIFVEHDWNPMKDLQAMDRAHRIGQKKVVNVYRLITRNSLEEKIMSLQKFKILTANTVVGAENASLQTMGTSQIFDLFDGGSNKGQAGNSAAAAGSGGMNMNTIIENLPELWSEHQYEEEYDLGNFVQALKK